MIYVTGGTGLLGSHLLVELTYSTEHIRAIYRSENKVNQVKKLFQYRYSTKWETYFQKIEWVYGDILDVPFLEESMKGISKVYHCAALISFYPKDFQQLLKINREGTANIVNICLSENIDKLCYVSSTAAIGSGSKKIIDENTKWKNTPTTSCYSISKYSAEKEVWRGIEEGLNAVMVNPCVILGAGNWNDSSLTIFRTLRNGLKFYPPGSNAIVDARDVSEIMIKLMDSAISSERYLCIGQNQSFKSLMKEVSSGLNVKPPSVPVGRFIVNLAQKMAAIGSFFTRKKPNITTETVESLFSHRQYDNSKICRELNFEFKTIEETIEYSIKGRIN